MTEDTMIGHYKVLETLGTGAMGTVQIAVDTYIDRPVAIKSLRADFLRDPEFVSRFRGEAKSLALLNHPNIAALYTPVFEAGQLHLVMELVKGKSLEQILQERGKPLPVKETLAIAAQACDGLAYAHEMGVVHRDVKPSNLMIGNDGRLKIMDFGIARVQGSVRLTRSGTAVGTPLYMSPEQCRGGEGDERSDIYSLGVVLYEMLAGAPPFSAPSEYELIQAQITQVPPSLVPRAPGVSPNLESAIMIALAKKPDQRYPSMKAFSDALGATPLRADATTVIQSATHLLEIDSGGDSRAQPSAKTLDVALSRTNAVIRSIRRRGFGLTAVLSLAVLALAASQIVMWLNRSAPIVEPSAPTPAPIAVASTEPEPAPHPAVAPAPSPTIAIEAAKPVATPAQDPAADLRALIHDDRSARLKAADFEYLTSAVKLQALEKARALADAGVAEGQFALGMLLLSTPDHIDINGAFTALAKAAEQNYPDAEVNLAVMYQRKNVLPSGQDLAAARLWFSKAAEQGEAKARYWLGCYTQFGWGGADADAAKAADLFNAALSDGFAPARGALQALDKGTPSESPCMQ